jgi:hypothetical protein
MNEHDKLDRLKGNEVGDELAIGKEERHMAREERELEREMRELERAEARAQKEIEEELRREHWGQEPERPLRWPDREGAPDSARRSDSSRGSVGKDDG